MNETLSQIFTLFKNITLNATGVKRDFYQLIADKDIRRAIDLMQDNTNEVDEAIREYNPDTHDVMKRPDKRRKKGEPYKTEKLPRTRQRYINEVELFFLLSYPIVWKKDDGDDDAYQLFLDFLEKNHMFSKIRRLKRCAGSETEAALAFRMYRTDDGQMDVDVFLASRSTGYQLRPLFDQYGNLVAFAYGYTTKESTGAVQHWDILTPENTVECVKARIGWDVNVFPNPTGKINLLYAKQKKAWDGVERRIDREEKLDSKVGDTNNYFADPIAMATADVVQMMQKDNQAERIGTFIQLVGDKSRFEYANPPQNSETRRDEMQRLDKSILFDSFTPDFSIENMKGFGTLSADAIKNAMVLGYIKRAKNIEDWEEYITRLRNVIIAVLKELHPEKRSELDGLKISFEFAEPWMSDKQKMWESIGSLYQNGLVSLEQAVTMLALTDAPEEEIERIRKAEADKMAMENGGTDNGQGE